MQVYQSELETLRKQQQELESRMSLEAASHRGRIDTMAENFDAQKPTLEPRAARRASSARSRIAPVTTEAENMAPDTDDASKQGGGEGGAPKTSRGDMLKRYFDAMSEYPDYKERRESRLNEVKPFSFEQREARRSKSTKARRQEERREEEEQKYQEMVNSRFQANPVPPTTYLHKYELMVQEWCARKESIRLVAETKAKRMKAAAQPGIEAAEAFRMQKESHHKSRPRAVSAHNPKKHPAFVAKEVPIDCKVKKWDELRLAEEERRQRIRFRAEQLLHFAKRPPRMESETREHAEKNKQIDAQVKDKKKAVENLQESNPNFTFKPTVETTVPDYEYLWAKDRVEMAKRKQSKPTTVPAEFKLRPTRSTKAKIEMDMRRSEVEGTETRWPYKSTKAKVKPTPVPKPVPESEVRRPAATKAHAMHCEVVYKSIEERARAEEAARKELAERRERDRAVSQRMAPHVGKSHTAVHKETIARKVAEKKALQQESAKEAKEKLDEIKRRVDEKPPLFMEPAYLDQVAKARANTEEQVMNMLKEHGLAEQTLSAVMGRDGSGGASGAGAGSTAVDHVTASDVEPSSAGMYSTDRIDDRSLVAPTAATTHAQPLSPAPAATAAPVATTTTTAPAAGTTKPAATKKPKKKRRGSDSSDLSSFESSSNDSFSSSSSY